MPIRTLPSCELCRPGGYEDGYPAGRALLGASSGGTATTDSTDGFIAKSGVSEPIDGLGVSYS